MPKVRIDQDRCKGCELCILYCPKGLINRSNSLNARGIYPAVFEEYGQCSGCRSCALVCPDVCIEVYK